MKKLNALIEEIVVKGKRFDWGESERARDKLQQWLWPR